MTESARLLLALVRDCQAVLTGYLMPGGISAEQAVDTLLGLLDGPRWREAEAAVEGSTPFCDVVPFRLGTHRPGANDD